LLPEQVLVETTVDALAADPARVSDGLRLSLAGLTGDPDELAAVAAPAVRSVKLPSARATSDQPGDDHLLHVLVALCREIDVSVVVEHVETPRELAALHRVGPVLAQGYLLSRPLPAEALDEVVLRGCLPV
jgi:predicted signal transduction protein with EAL and GGDEF domain